MKYNNLAKYFTDQFEEFFSILQEHIEYNGEILNHVFFGECNNYFIKLLEDEKDLPRIKELFNFLELMAIQGDNEVKNLLSVTILARMGDSKEILDTAYKYMGPETRKSSNEIEEYWDRS
jgi:hypothetical protein